MRRCIGGAFALGAILSGTACGVETEDNKPLTATSSRALVTDPESHTQEELREFRQREVAEYNEERSAGWDIVDTRVSPSGQIIDYVAAETLIPDDPDAPFATPPFNVDPQPEIPASDDAPAIRQGGTEIEVEPSLRPPPGTIPVLREQFTAYVDDPRGSDSLAQYIQDLIDPANVSSGGHLYARHSGTGDNTDANGVINLWRYGETNWSGDMSLMQLSQSCTSSGVIQTAEAGFNVLPTLYGDTNLHLFTFFTTIGYGVPNAHYQKGYNLNVNGFVPWSGATTYPGATIASSTLSSVNGAQYECLIEWTLGGDGNWWLYACSNWVGYYPTANSTTTVASKRINYGLMSSRSCQYNLFGEAASRNWDDYGVWGAVDMGSGQFASAGFANAAYIRHPQYYSLSGVWTDMPNNPLTGAGVDNDCYTVSNMVSSIGNSGTRGFYLGGPGYNQPGYPCQ